MGVKHVAVSAHRTGSDAMALVYDIDVRWAGSPDISLLLTPSRKWIVKQRRIGTASQLSSGPGPSVLDMLTADRADKENTLCFTQTEAHSMHRHV